MQLIAEGDQIYRDVRADKGHEEVVNATVDALETEVAKPGPLVVARACVDPDRFIVSWFLGLGVRANR